MTSGPIDNPEKPTFHARRGIKLGRVRKVKETRITINKRTGEESVRNRTVGYADAKTGKRLNATEINSYKAVKAFAFNSNLRKKYPEGHVKRGKKVVTGSVIVQRPNRKKESVPQYEYVDRFTGKALSKEQIREVRKAGLQAQVTHGLLPPKILRAIDTIVARKGNRDRVERAMQKWYIRYGLGETNGPWYSGMDSGVFNA